MSDGQAGLHNVGGSLCQVGKDHHDRGGGGDRGIDDRGGGDSDYDDDFDDVGDGDDNDDNDDVSDDDDAKLWHQRANTQSVTKLKSPNFEPKYGEAFFLFERENQNNCVLKEFQKTF